MSVFRCLEEQKPGQKANYDHQWGNLSLKKPYE